MFFFQTTIRKLCGCFPNIFNTDTEEVQEEQRYEHGGEANYALLGIIIAYVQETFTSFNEAMKESTMQVLYVFDFIIQKRKKEKQQIEQIRNKYKR